MTHDRNYYQRREVIEAAALVRTVLNPNDQIALLTWLRSAAVGVPDAALIPLWAEDFPGWMVELDDPEGRAMQGLRSVVESAAGEPPRSNPRTRGSGGLAPRSVLSSRAGSPICASSTGRTPATDSSMSFAPSP